MTDNLRAVCKARIHVEVSKNNYLGFCKKPTPDTGRERFCITLSDVELYGGKHHACFELTDGREDLFFFVHHPKPADYELAFMMMIHKSLAVQKSLG